MPGLMSSTLGMTVTGVNKGWSGKNRFEADYGNMITSGSFSWTNFRNSYKSGGNRAIIWVNSKTYAIKGIYYLTKDTEYAVRMIFEPSSDSAQTGTFTEKTH